MTDYIRPPKYPAYKEARDAAEFQQNGNIILPIESLLRETRLMLHAEGYVELTDAEITVFIDLSCSDAIAMNSKLNGPISVAGIECALQQAFGPLRDNHHYSARFIDRLHDGNIQYELLVVDMGDYRLMPKADLGNQAHVPDILNRAMG